MTMIIVISAPRSRRVKMSLSFAAHVPPVVDKSENTLGGTACTRVCQRVCAAGGRVLLRKSRERRRRPSVRLLLLLHFYTLARSTLLAVEIKYNNIIPWSLRVHFSPQSQCGLSPRDPRNASEFKISDNKLYSIYCTIKIV